MLVALLQTAAEATAVSPLAILAALLGLQVFAFFWSCYPCCQNCTLFADNFDRANTTTLSDYTEVSGDWAVASNRLDPPGSGLLKVTLSTPVSPDGVKISATCNFGGGVGEVRLLVDYVDALNYHYAAVTSSGSTTATIRIWKVTGGSPTALTSADTIGATSSFSWSADFTLEVCWEDDRIGASYERSGFVTVSQGAITTAHGGNFTGLETVSVGINARFDDLLVATLADGCERCGEVCEFCEHASFQVDVAGVANGTCSDCAALNQSYVIDRVPPDAECLWEGGDEQTCAGTQDWSLRMGYLPGGDVTGDIGADAFLEGASFKKTSPDPCDEWVTYDFPFFSSAGAQCSFGSATFKVTAL
jgi:hypothetical protein